MLLAREMYLVGVSEEELRPDPKPEGPKTPRGKWENFGITINGMWLRLPSPCL